MSTPIRVLILDDQAADAELMLHELRQSGFDPAWHRAEAESDYVALLDPGLDVILADYTLPQFNALRALVLLQERGLDIPFIVVTSAVSEEAAVECMRKGASDYILKDRLTRLGQAVQRALEDKKDRVERKRADLALRDSEERFRIAAKSVSDVVWQWDIETGRLDWYGDIDALLGYGPGQFPRTIQAWEKTLHPDDAPRVRSALEAHFKDDRPYREEYRVLRKDGSLAHWRDIGTALRDDRGKAYQMVGAIADITKQTQAEEQLRRSEAALKKAQQVSHVGSWIWNIPANRLEWSDEMFRIFGIEKENFTGDLSEVIGRAIHPDDRAAVERANLSVIKDKVPQPLEYRVVWPDGTVHVVWAEVGELILDEAGRPHVLTGIMQDITLRKQTEEALRASEEKWRSLVTVLPDYVSLLDREGNILFLNHYAEGFAEKDVIGSSVYNYLSRESVRIFRDKIQACLETKKIQKFEHTAMGDKGLMRDYEDYSIPFVENNIAKHTMIISRDITERKKAEEEIKNLAKFPAENPFPILRLNKDGIILYANEASQPLLQDWGSTIGDYSPKSWCDISRDVLTSQKRRTITVGYGQLFYSFVVVPISGAGYVNLYGEDITERKRAEEALRESEENFRALANNANDGIYIAVGNGIHAYVNKRAAEITGYSEAEFLKLGIKDLVHPDELKKIMERFRKRLLGEPVPPQYETIIIRKDGKSVPIELTAAKTVWQGQPAVMVIIRDITERQQAEEALQSHEARYRELFDHMNSGVAVYKARADGADFIFTDFNQAGERIDKVRKETLIGKGVVQVFPSVKEFGLFDVFQRVWKTGEPEHHPISLYKDERLVGWRENYVYKLPSGEIVAVYDDLSERQQAEEALKRSEERYRTLVENANEAIVVAQDGVLKFANRKTSEITGYSRREMVGKPFVEFIHPDDRQLVSDNYARRIKGEKAPEVYAFRIVGKSGKDTWVEIRAVWIKWQDLPATLNFLSDIGDRRRAEEALRKSEHMLKMTLNSLRDAVFILDAQTGKTEECNLIASEIFGYKRSEFLGRTTEFLHVDKPALEDFRKKLYAAVEEKGFLHNFEFHMKRRDGKVFPTEHSVFPLRDEKHALTGWVSVVSDITERKQAEDRIQSLMREIEFILGATKTGLDIIDSKFNLRFVDPAWSKARGDWLGRKCYDYFMGRRRPCPNCAMSQALRTKEMVVTEAVLLKEAQRPVQVISIPFQDEKGEWLLAEVRVDITERKRTEEALLASREELRSLSTRLQSLREEERTILAREIHDELGQALTALNMDLSWLSNKLPQSQPPLLKKVESMSAVVAATMQTVKRLSSELRPGLLDDLGLVAAMQWQAEEFGKRTWIKMKISFLPEEMTVERDLSTAIFRIFQELLTNIARHAKATRVEVSLKRKAGALELRVKDNGRGIKKTEIANPRSLGLIGVRERALAFGGQVEIVGVPRQGTRVVVRLPERGKGDDKNSSG